MFIVCLCNLLSQRFCLQSRGYIYILFKGTVKFLYLTFYGLDLHHLQDHLFTSQRERKLFIPTAFSSIICIQLNLLVQRTFQCYANGKVNAENSKILPYIVLCYIWDKTTQHFSTMQKLVKPCFLY